MHLNRFGFNFLAIVWLVPIIGIDFYSNTVLTGLLAKAFYWKLALDVALTAFAAYFVMHPKVTTTAAKAQAKIANGDDDIIDVAQINALEYMYCLFLSAYAAVQWWYLYNINADSTGMVSILAAVWSFVSLAIVVTAGIQFWRLKKGAIVELHHKMVQ